MKRLDEIVSNIEKTEILADVGCDHGYISQKVLEKGLANKVIISDISKLCLSKAETLLDNYIKQGKVIPFVADGFKGYSSYPTLAVIAGMGGEEIIKILEEYKPNKLVLQPMKNADKLRIFLTQNGYKITKDYTFKDIKFYDLIVCEKGKQELTEKEVKYGLTNLRIKPQAFIEKLNKEKALLLTVLSETKSDLTKFETQEKIREIDLLI